MEHIGERIVRQCVAFMVRWNQGKYELTRDYTEIPKPPPFSHFTRVLAGKNLLGGGGKRNKKFFIDDSNNNKRLYYPTMPV